MTNINQNQDQLIDNVLKGSQSDFIELIQPYYERLYLKAYSIIKDKNEAKDVLQDAFISAYLALPKFKKESNIYTWLYRIVVNKALDHLKSKKREANYINPEVNPYAEKEISIFSGEKIQQQQEQNELYEYLIYIINKLEYKYKEMIIMRYFDGLTYEEIAEVKAIRLGTVKSRLHKAKELLKKELLKEGKFNVMDFFEL